MTAKSQSLNGYIQYGTSKLKPNCEFALNDWKQESSGIANQLVKVSSNCENIWVPDTGYILAATVIPS